MGRFRVGGRRHSSRWLVGNEDSAIENQESKGRFRGFVAVCAEVAYFDILLGHREDIGIQWDADIAEESGFREKFHAVQPLVVLCKNGFSLGLIDRSWW